MASHDLWHRGCGISVVSASLGSFARKRRRPEADDPRFAADFRYVEIDDAVTVALLAPVGAAVAGADHHGQKRSGG